MPLRLLCSWIAQVFWGMFEDGTAVFEELFTHSLFFIDRVWLERNATRDQFPKVGYVGGSQFG